MRKEQESSSTAFSLESTRNREQKDFGDLQKLRWEDTMCGSAKPSLQVGYFDVIICTVYDLFIA